MKIAICSKGRAGGQVKTLHTLQGVFPKSEVFLFVEPQEEMEYRVNYGGLATIVSIGENDRGIRFVRKFIFDYFGTETIAMLDDDITGFFKRLADPKKMAKLSALSIRKMFEDLEQVATGFPETTISYRPSNYLYEGEFKMNTRAWCIRVWNLEMLKGAIVDVEVNEMIYDDYDFTLSIFRAGLSNFALYEYAFECVLMGKNKGGITKFRNEVNTRSVEWMKAKWGECVSIFINEKLGIPEIKVHWKKAFNLFNGK